MKIVPTDSAHFRQCENCCCMLSTSHRSPESCELIEHTGLGPMFDCSNAVKAEAMTRVVAWQLTQEMERQGISKATLAEDQIGVKAKLKHGAALGLAGELRVGHFVGPGPIDQAAGLAAQERDLKAAGAERIGEQVSSTAKRVKLAECLASAPHTGPEE